MPVKAPISDLHVSKLILDKANDLDYDSKLKLLRDTMDVSTAKAIRLLRQETIMTVSLGSDVTDNFISKFENGLWNKGMRWNFQVRTLAEFYGVEVELLVSHNKGNKSHENH